MESKPVTAEPQQNSPKPFEPTKGMIKWFEAAIELGHTASITSIAEKSELDRSNWYQWLEMPGFVEWWDSQWQQFLKLNRWKLDAIGMKQAERNYDYWKTMMERTGNITQEKGTTTANQFNINLGDAELKRIIGE